VLYLDSEVLEKDKMVFILWPYFDKIFTHLLLQSLENGQKWGNWKNVIFTLDRDSYLGPE
jgi:hypothetical protein